MVELLKGQKSHCNKVVNRLKKYNRALDCSPLGSGKTYLANYICKSYSHAIVISTGAILSKWKEIKRDNPDITTNVKYATFAKAGDTIISANLNSRTDGTLIVIDEVHNFKNKSQRTRKFLDAIELVQRNKYDLLCLSSTPVDKEQQCVIIARVLGLYRGELAVQAGNGAWFYPGYDSFVNTIRDLFGMSLMSYPVDVKLCRKLIETRTMDILKNRLCVNEKGIESDYSVNRINKEIPVNNGDGHNCLQLLSTLAAYKTANSEVFSNIAEVMMTLEFTKIKYYKHVIKTDILSNPDKKFVIMGNYTFTLLYLAKFIEGFTGENVLVVNGKTPDDQRKMNIDKFQENNLDNRFIVGNIQLLSTGIDLDDKYGHLCRIGYIFPSYNGINIKQAINRFHRMDTRSNSVVNLCFITYKDNRVELKESKLLENLSIKFNVMGNFCE